jgi:NitT/TauT family transport system substrate-binding protein
VLREDAGGRAKATIIDWEFACNGSRPFDVGHFLRYERPGEGRLEPHFSSGFAAGGGTLPDDWREPSRLADLAGIAGGLTNASRQPGVAVEHRQLDDRARIRPAMIRRTLLRSALAAAGLYVAGDLKAEFAFASSASGSTRVRLGYVGNPCEAATFVAPGAPSFEHARLAASLTGYASDEALIAALAAGAVDAASVTLPALMKPLANGADVRVVAGLHAGCLRVVAPETAQLDTLADLRGKTIATDRLHGPAMNLLAALLRRHDLDPERDVTWKVFEMSALLAALDGKDVACVAASDPLGYFLIAEKVAQPYLDTADGGFSCGGDIAHGHHCFLAMSGKIVEERPAIATALARAYVATSDGLTRHPGSAAVSEVRGGYIGGDMYQTIGMLSSYDWSASSDLALEEIELTARDFRRAGLLRRDTDPYALASRAFVDIASG